MIRALGIGAAFAAAFAGQVAIQQPLAKANALRATRSLATTPSSMAFLFAAGGVKEAASDALWLTVLPRLGRSWAEPERKAAWIEGVTGVMIDAHPRALTPTLYAMDFLSLIRKRHPAIERIARRALEARVRRPFEERRRDNERGWEIPEKLGMNLYQYGTPEEKRESLAWLGRAAADPHCYTLLVDFVSRLGSEAGRPLEGWELWLVRSHAMADPETREALERILGRAAGGRARPKGVNASWLKYYLGKADDERVAVLRAWAREVEEATGAWPATLEPVLARAPAEERERWPREPARRAAIASGIVLDPRTRDLYIPERVAEETERQREEILLLLDNHELVTKSRATDLKQAEDVAHRTVDRPPRHGTRWALDAKGEPVIATDLADPRLRR